MQIHVLLLLWEEDDLDLHTHVRDLQLLFTGDCNFTTTQTFNIPSAKPYKSLSIELHEWIAKSSKKENLLIVYYNGHGHLDSIHHLKWYAYKE